MDRRSFCKSGCAVLLGGAIPEPRCKRVFRLEDDGRFREIDRRAVKKGDRIIQMGLDDSTGELWCAPYIFTADSDHIPCGGLMRDGTRENDPHGSVYSKFGSLKQLAG